MKAFFIHGTGVRDAGFTGTIPHVASGLVKAGVLDREDDLIGLPWYREYGAPTDTLNLTLPPSLRRATGQMPPAPDDLLKLLKLWELLDLDPLTELRFLAVEGITPAPVVPGGLQNVVDRLNKVPRLTRAGTGLDEGEVRGAFKAILASQPFQQALEVAGINDTPLVTVVNALARATVAQALAQRRHDNGIAPLAADSADTRKQLEDHLADRCRKALGLTGVADWVGARFGAWVNDQAARWAEERRAGFTDPAGRFVGDLLRYLRDSAPVLNYLRQAISDTPGPKLLIGHSLGGILLVDLMSGDNAPQDVRLLVTAGSQSPVLHQIGALAHLRPGSGRAPFTPWLNIFDPRDFLAYYTSDVFEGAEDLEVNGGVPFPAAHSAYWTNPEVYSAIRKRLTQVEG
ncbi:hypothetical protein [Deinococcus soli (ex Cha et al. 2016)]|uniref:hypothetical protein n=1 Tax=Deinococcus soli (ex Cha et al. 2016) TaxID=1309411 RepID=UPI001669FAF8|nr:hypothetical protein [Deinococcus soli (ex Cha et al. 2016)]GGB84696.1 hypothetical protein GCM10008019_45850 [Deinococcus soli (ex Cha et al. 2016)]